MNKLEQPDNGFGDNAKNSHVFPILSFTAATLYPCLFIYFNNAGEAYFKDVIGISTIFLLIAVIIYLMCFFLIKVTDKAALITTLTQFLLMNFALIEAVISKVFPILYYWHIVLILLFILIHIGYLIYKIKNVSLFRYINTAILLVFCGLIILNAAISTPTIVQKLTYEKAEMGDVLHLDMTAINNSPNVYFFLFDEYGGLDCLERYCNYDNSDFFKSMEERGFNISSHSTNGTVSTTVAIPNLLNFSIVNTEEMLDSERRQQLKNPALYTLMKKNGYKINTMDYVKFIDQENSDYKFDYTGNYISDSAADLICKRTIFYPLVGIKGTGPLQILNKAFEYCKTSSDIQDNSLFTLGYFQFPHSPYIVDANGNATNSFDMESIKDTSFYLGQVRYSNVKIIDMVDYIIKNDPKSIIIIQSDHGFRQPLFLQDKYGIKMEDPALEYKYMASILNCVYYKGEKLDIEGLSGINTIRLVLNRLFEANLQMIEE